MIDRWPKMNDLWRPCAAQDAVQLMTVHRVRAGIQVCLYSQYGLRPLTMGSMGPIILQSSKSLALNMLPNLPVETEESGCSETVRYHRSKRLATNAMWKKQNWPQFLSRCVFYVAMTQAGSNSSGRKGRRTGYVLPIGDQSQWIETERMDLISGLALCHSRCVYQKYPGLWHAFCDRWRPDTRPAGATR